jgi:Zn-dependent protease with chaperone function
MRTDWDGYYLDGRTPTRRPAQIRLMRGGLEVSPEGGATLWWPYPEVRQTQGFYAGEEVRLERGAAPETLVVADLAVLESLQEMAPEIARRFHDPRRRRWRMKVTLLAAAAVVAITVALYVWGIPLLATAVAASVPVAWEERFGAAVVTEVARPERTCAEPTRRRKIEEIVERLAAAAPRSPYRFRVRVVDDATVNAFAAPGGFVVVFRGLLERTRTPEELAGVLAHEMEHVLQRHSTKALIQHASTGLLLVALTGDMTGVMAYGLESARVLGTLQYSRRAEEEADQGGMRLLLGAGIDPGGMIAFFEGLEEKRGSGPSILKYLSTHPRLEDRIQRLRQLARQPGAARVTLFEGYDWSDIRKICPGGDAR